MCQYRLLAVGTHARCPCMCQYRLLAVGTHAPRYSGQYWPATTTTPMSCSKVPLTGDLLPPPSPGYWTADSRAVKGWLDGLVIDDVVFVINPCRTCKA